MEREDARHWFGAQGLPIRDPDVVFNLIDADHSESISMEELVLLCFVFLCDCFALFWGLFSLRDILDYFF